MTELLPNVFYMLSFLSLTYGNDVTTYDYHNYHITFQNTWLRRAWNSKSNFIFGPSYRGAFSSAGVIGACGASPARMALHSSASLPAAHTRLGAQQRPILLGCGIRKNHAENEP